MTPDGQSRKLGENAVRDTEAKPKDSRGMEGRDMSPLIEFVEPSTAQEWGQLPIDPDVKLPADIQVTIARGKAAHRKFKKSWRKQELIRPKGPAGGPFLITSVVDKEVQDRRDAALSALEKRGPFRPSAGSPVPTTRIRHSEVPHPVLAGRRQSRTSLSRTPRSGPRPTA